MNSEEKARLLAITDPQEFKRALEEIFPGKEKITLADIGIDVCRHLYKNVIKQSIEDYCDPKEVFAMRKRGD